MKNLFKNEELNSFANLLLDNGFRILKHKDESTWFHYEKDNKLGYVQNDRFDGFTFSSTHKPCKEFGTGFRISARLSEPTIENAMKTLIDYPNWAQGDTRVIKKYSSLEEYQKRETILETTIIEP